MQEEIRTGIADIEENVTESMADYARELEASFRKINEGDILSGTVVDVSEEGVILDLGYYAQGIIKAEDMSADPGYSFLTQVQKGDVLEAAVVRRDDGAGNILLSRVEAANTLGWERLRALMEENKPLAVKVSEVVNKGVVVYVEGIRGFIPASQLSLDYVEDLEAYRGKELEVKITALEPEKERLILSAKVLLREQQEEGLRHKVSMIVPGSILEGRVESLMPYGAFVDLGDGLSGLVHISQICERRIGKPSEVLKVGEIVKVKVLNTNDQRISLSIRQAMEEEPEEIVRQEIEQYSEGESVGTSLGALLKNLNL